MCVNWFLTNGNHGGGEMDLQLRSLHIMRAVRKARCAVAAHIERWRVDEIVVGDHKYLVEKPFKKG